MIYVPSSADARVQPSSERGHDAYDTNSRYVDRTYASVAEKRKKKKEENKKQQDNGISAWPSNVTCGVKEILKGFPKLGSIFALCYP